MARMRLKRPATLAATVLMMMTACALAFPLAGFAGKRAVLMYDADNQRVLYEEDGYAERYPASLTKMMTLYLLFDALRSGDVTLHTRLQASQRAAGQPQTNISLRRGDRITVDQAVEALIVRSANDVAVVVAEHLGGSVPGFARKMNRQARELGMRDTSFRNPHGLPDREQVTTARDMAVLGAALRHDFPQYYHYFSTDRFSYKGRRYRSHNHVLDELPGVDGIKTGYINDSGFNLVSSLKRNHVNLVAVVMGGRSSRSRDREMVRLLRRTYRKLAAKRRQAPFRVASAPTPAFKPGTSRRATSLASAANTAKAPALDKLVSRVTRKAAATASPKFNVAVNTNPVTVMPANNRFDLSVSFNNAGSNGEPGTQAGAARGQGSRMPQAQTLDYQLATINKQFDVPSYIIEHQHVDPGKAWAVQIGVFRSTRNARQALTRVMQQVPEKLHGAIAQVERAQEQERQFHRARLKNLSRKQANAMCYKLLEQDQDCFVTKLN